MKVKANYEAKQTANVVRVIIPVPKTTSKCRFQKATQHRHVLLPSQCGAITGCW